MSCKAKAINMANEEDSYRQILLKRISESEYACDKILLVAEEDDEKCVKYFQKNQTYMLMISFF